MFDLKKVKVTVVLVGLFFISSLMSCSKNSDEISEITPDDVEIVEIENDNFTESDEDLLNVDYKEFYDQLAPHGEWIEVTDKELGVDLDKSSASGKKVHKKMTFAELFGVNSAYADDADFGAFFVWKPAPELAVGISTGNTSVTPVASYIPYTNGQWVNTDAGWYFQAPTPYEEVVHHYGRWAHSPSAGWVWVPGRVWSPAWVDWRTDEEYVAWTPVPPGIHIIDDHVMHPYVYEDRYVVVEKRYFLEPQIYKHKHKKGKLFITQLTPVPGITVVNNTIINQGPDVFVIQNYYPTPIPVVKIERVTYIDQVRYTGGVIHTYSPKFKKFKPGKVMHAPVRKPKNYTSFDVWTAGNKNVNKVNGDPCKVDNNSKENVIYNGSNKSSNNSVKDNKNKGKNKNNVINGKKNEVNKNKGNEKKKNENTRGTNKKKDHNSKINDHGNKKQNDSKINNNKSRDSQKQNKSGKDNGSNNKSGRDKGNNSKGKKNK